MGIHDVIVAGLGPGGAAAAVELARAGLKVLALQPRTRGDKPCGGCLSRRGFSALGFLDPPAWVSGHPVSALWLAGPDRPPRRYATGEPGAFFVERGRLNRFLEDRVRESGVEVRRERLKGVTLRDGLYQVETNREGGACRAFWLVGADGVGSRVARGLGFKPTSYVYLALAEERPLEGRVSLDLEGAALMDLGCGGWGYGWAFGRGGTVNQGLAARVPRDGAGNGVTRRLAAAYAAFLERHGLGRPGLWRGAAIPCPDRRRPEVRRGRAALVGDAAGLADPFLGEGIGQAVTSGRLAAGAILKGDLALYAKWLDKTLLAEHFHARWVTAVVQSMPGEMASLAAWRPGAVEMGWKLLRGEMHPGGIWAGLLAGALGRTPRLDPRARAYYSNPLKWR